MIGLVASPDDFDVAEEFFELFKTPGENRHFPSTQY
jgi:hypothetical protein